MTATEAQHALDELQADVLHAVQSKEGPDTIVAVDALYQLMDVVRSILERELQRERIRA